MVNNYGPKCLRNTHVITWDLYGYSPGHNQLPLITQYVLAFMEQLVIHLRFDRRSRCTHEFKQLWWGVCTCTCPLMQKLRDQMLDRLVQRHGQVPIQPLQVSAALVGRHCVECGCQNFFSAVFERINVVCRCWAEW